MVKSVLKLSREAIIEMGDKRKQRLKKYMQTKGNYVLQLTSSQRRLTSANNVIEDEKAETSLRTTVIVEESGEPLESNEGKDVVHSSNSSSSSPTKIKRKRGILNKWVSKMMPPSSSSQQQQQDNCSPPPPPPPPLPLVDVTKIDIAELRNNSPLIDRKRSEGTVDTEKVGEELDSLPGGDTTSNDNNNKVYSMLVAADAQSHADTLDATTVVVSNQSNAMTRILCNMSPGETTLREVKAWRNAACDLLLL